MRELSLGILDLATNSVNASAKVVKIELKADRALNLIYIRIIDDGCGMSDELIADVMDSVDLSPQKRGMGLRFAKMRSKMCGGEFIIKSKIGVGTEVYVSYKLDCVDRPPIGDLAMTMVTLMLRAPEIEFNLVYVVDGREYEFSSKVTDISDPGALGAIKALGAVREVIKENIEIINGGQTL